jgi:dihydrofolate reductase
MPTRFAVFIAATLDGFIAREDGSFDFLDPYTEDHGYADFFAGVDALVIGRGTYDTVLAFPDWPYGEKRLIVCTKSPAPAPRHGEELFPGTPRELADRLAREGVRRVYLDGGALIRSFLGEGLVDELAIHVVPLLLGKGRPLFASGIPELPLRLVEAKSFASGLVQLRYLRG